MREIHNVMIIGLGALGTIYAERLSNCPDVQISVIVDQARKDRYEANGIWYNDKRYDFHYILPSEEWPAADLILLATKSSGLASAMDMIAPFVGEDTILMSLMNGISSERLLAERFGAHHVLYALFYGHMGMNVDGKISHDGVNQTFFGEADNRTISTRVAACRDLFEKAGLAYVVPDDMIHALWQKYMIILAFNQLAALFQEDYTPFKVSPTAMSLARHIMDEAAQVAAALGVDQAEALPAETEEAVARLPADLVPSIRQDYMMHRQMEVDIFSGELCRLGRELGIPTPYNDAVRDILTAMNEKNSLTQP